MKKVKVFFEFLLLLAEKSWMLLNLIKYSDIYYSLSLLAFAFLMFDSKIPSYVKFVLFFISYFDLRYHQEKTKELKDKFKKSIEGAVFDEFQKLKNKIK